MAISWKPRSLDTEANARVASALGRVEERLDSRERARDELHAFYSSLCGPQEGERAPEGSLERLAAEAARDRIPSKHLDFHAGPGARAALERERSERILNPTSPFSDLARIRAQAGNPLPTKSIKCIRRARPEDVTQICRLQASHHLDQRLSPTLAKKGGSWLVQQDLPSTFRKNLGVTKDCWVAEGENGEIAAYQIVTTPQFCSRTIDQHRFLDGYRDRALAVLTSRRWIYMSQIIVAKPYLGQGLAERLQTEVLSHYQKWPLVAHVGVMTQADLHTARRSELLEVRGNNEGSHRYHLQQGYVPVAWTSDLFNTKAYANTFRTGNGPDLEEAMAGLLYINFRDGTPAPAVDEFNAVETFLEAPMTLEDLKIRQALERDATAKQALPSRDPLQASRIPNDPIFSR